MDVVELYPRKEAEEVLQNYWPEGAFPVEPRLIAARLEIPVVSLDLPEGIAGALVKKRNAKPRIYLSRGDGDNRQRFTCAHELGHYITRTRIDPTGAEYEYIDLRDIIESGGGQVPSEVFANQFAAELLMPIDEVITGVRQGKSLYDLARWFGVSPTAMAIRLRVLNLVENAPQREMQAQLPIV